MNASTARNAAVNALTICREMEDNWLGSHSVFHDQHERLVVCAMHVTDIEEHPRFDWGDQKTDFESYCALFALVVQEWPAKPITRARVARIIKTGRAL